MKMEQMKKKISTMRRKTIDFLDEHVEEIIYGGMLILVGGVIVYFKGYMSGVKCGRTEWDFGNDAGEWAVLMEEDGEFRTALPISAIKEVMDNHRVKEWTNDMWRKLDR